MKTTQKQFEFFKKECKKWLDKMELNIYSVYYQQCELKYYAKTSIDYLGMTATIALNSDWNNEIRPLNNKELAKTAKHEIIHLLLAKFAALAESRFVSQDETDQGEHELVRKLEKLIS